LAYSYCLLLFSLHNSTSILSFYPFLQIKSRNFLKILSETRKRSDELKQAVTDFYKKDSIRVQYNWWDRNYDVVELDQWEKGNELSHPYVIKFTVQTYDGNETGQLGTDTITFGVSPIQFNKEMDEKNLAASKVELLDYSHSEPSN
jgi:hypothetical protein